MICLTKEVLYMPSAKLKFDGKLIEELSQKIPSTLFALNELLKNSYDAFAPSVTVKIEPSKQTITISDNGNGMGSSDIDKLFHIAHSSKSYGHTVEQDGIERITQGSKGLGFLAAFKFGDKVEWKTCKNGVHSSFSLRKSDLVSKEDLTGTEIVISTGTHTQEGTIITVYAGKEKIDGLLEDLSDPRVTEKLAATIVDDSFEIKIEFENHNQCYTTKKLKSFQLESEENQLFYVKYNSEENEVNFYNKGEHKASFPFSLKRTDYSVNVELIIFFFSSGRNSKSISPLNRRLHDDALYPLVYVNRNLFNNIVTFDPEVLRKKSSGKALPQMIGRVCLYSKSQEIDFNSDRTNFVENSFTKDLLKDLKSLNELIQTKGSELKNQLKKNTHGKKLPLGKAMPDLESNKLKKSTASILIDRKKAVDYYVPSAQINLEEFIFQVKNCQDQEVDKGEVNIIVDGQTSINKVLPSVEVPCKKEICFRYNDKNTGLVSSEVLLNFKELKSAISGKTQEKSLFTIPSSSKYCVDLETVSDLIYAIDKAYSSNFKDVFLPLIACSIRAIFEISSDKVFKARKSWFKPFDNSKFDSSVKREIKDSLLKNVVNVVILLKKNQSLVTEISTITEISYSTLNNLLDLGDFKNSVKTSHIGAHQSSRYLSKPKIEACAHICGLFVVICNVLINLDNNKISTLTITNVDESDLNAYLI